MKKNFYAVTLWDGRNTTTGTANEKTGRFSIAWIVTRKQLRNYSLGLSLEGFEAEIEWAKRENVLNAWANKDR